MKILLDMQPCQTGSRFSPVGRYSRSLAHSIIRNAGSHEVWILLNELMPDSADSLRAEFGNVIPNRRIVTFVTPGPVMEKSGANLRNARAAELIREYAVSELRPDAVLAMNLFEGFSDNAVTSINLLNAKALTATVVYDLSPLLHRNTLLKNRRYRRFYERKLESLKRADLLFAVSGSAGKDAAELLGIDPEKIETVPCAGADSPASIVSCIQNPLTDEMAHRSGKEHAVQAEKVSQDDAARLILSSLDHRLSGRKASGEENVYPQLSAALSKTLKGKPDILFSSAAAAISEMSRSKKKQLFVDLTAIVKADMKTGIQRAVRSVLSELLKSPPPGFDIVPVFGKNDGRFYCAHDYTRREFGFSTIYGRDIQIEFRDGDLFLGLDLTADLFPDFNRMMQQFRRRGVSVFFVVYDIIPILHPEWCHHGMPPVFERWLHAISEYSDGLICISESVADDVRQWIQTRRPGKARYPEVNFFHLGADIASSVPSSGLPADAEHVLSIIRSVPTFLMVGTVEPRKGHIQTLRAFELLWENGADVNLAIVGKLGWKMEALNSELLNHEKYGKHLLWLKGISDEYLEKIYSLSAALLFPSEAEGFGLPLIEAAQKKLPIIARDIPVFREIAGNSAFYFSNTGRPRVLADALLAWMDLYRQDMHPRSDTMPWLTWKESTKQLVSVVLK